MNAEYIENNLKLGLIAYKKRLLERIGENVLLGRNAAAGGALLDLESVERLLRSDLGQSAREVERLLR